MLVRDLPTTGLRCQVVLIVVELFYELIVPSENGLDLCGPNLFLSFETVSEPS